jgi:predicted HicB family RNase H-like nuclease
MWNGEKAPEWRSADEVGTSKPAKEPKTAVLNVRIRPSVKAMIERLANAERRSLANYVERLIETAAANAETDDQR